MSKAQSLVSIIIPTYNRAHLIVETLNSIVEQSYGNWECIIVDDGSNDNTITVLRAFKNDIRFQFYERPKNKPKGANACRNYGWSLAKGDYIKFFDSDDIMEPSFLEKQVVCLDKDDTLDFCACYWKIWYKDGSTMKNKPYTAIDYRTNPIKSYLLESHIFPTPSPLWRKSYLDGAEEFNEELQRGQEADFHFNIMINSPKYKFVEEFLFLVRVGHSSLKTNASSFESHLSVFKYFMNVSEKISQGNNPEKQKLLQYAFFRMSVSFYNIIKKSEPTKTNKLFKQYFSILKSMSNKAIIKKSLKLKLGYFALKYFGKGYKFFYFPEFDHRLKINY